MNGWENFFVGELGAAAALTGLVFVGISINLNKIMASPYLPNDALEALTALVAVLFITSLMLIPDQSLVARGIEVLLAGLVYWVVIVLLQINTLRTVPPTYRNRILRIIVVYQLAASAFIAAGIVFLVWRTPGYYFMVAATLLSFLAAFIDTWLLVVEINR